MPHSRPFPTRVVGSIRTELSPSEAVRLLEAHASLVQPQLSITPANARTVARLFSPLNRIPPAIELAAPASR